VTLTVTLSSLGATSAAGRVLTAPAMQSHNTFAAPDTVRPAAFDGVTLAGSTLTVTLPAKSVAVIEVR
jgi:alpha-N-arabinofuranosidase